MSAAAPHAWPAADDYHYLEDATPTDLAWEWLRRDPVYRKLDHDRAVPAGARVSIIPIAPPECIARWGCLTLPSPELDFTEAPILWSPVADPAVLRVLALDPHESVRRFDIEKCGVPATLVCGNGCEHVRLGCAGSAVRLDVVLGTVLDGPVWLVHDLALAGPPALSGLHRFLHLSAAGHLPAFRPSPSQRTRRQAIALRVADALAQGASIRDVGIMLYSADRVSREWSEEALKSQCRRLIALAREMSGGGYIGLLNS